MTEILIDLGFGEDLADVLAKYLGAGLLAGIFLLLPLFTIWIERKGAARFQMRVGPNRVGPYGLIQNFADVIKLLGKELIFPRNVDRLTFMLAPILMVTSVVGIVAVLPLAPTVIGTDLSIGVLYFISVSSLATIAVVMAGWGSNNKYALLGAFRTVAQLISYEIPLIFSLLIPVLLVGTMSMQGIVEFQGTYWLILYAPTAAVIFLLSNIAEIGRAPFDLIEAESELVAGFMIEYSGMAFAMFYLAEFLHAFLVAVIFAVLFLGGWQGPFAEDLPILGIVYLAAKTFFIYLVMMWVRMTLPRFRIDHLMDFNWKFLVPLSVAHLLVTGFVWRLFPDTDLSGGLFSRLVDEFPRMAVMGLSSVALGIVALSLLRQYAANQRQRILSLTTVDEEYALAITPQTTAQSSVVVVTSGD
ncbi:MAG: NADH-quinone oxidoreductase subunit NuoH [Chloroflexi bacterium]|nr:NADH-quinone oxidoreductase subunit NuoH [Chloroflexota bacterium]